MASDVAGDQKARPLVSSPLLRISQGVLGGAVLLLLMAAMAQADFVAVGSGGTIIRSPVGDPSQTGVDWNPQTSGTAMQLESVARGANQWMAVGACSVLKSPTGAAWTITPAVGNAAPLAVAAQGTTWVAAGRLCSDPLNVLSPSIVTSVNDGASWAAIPLPPAGYGNRMELYSVAYGGGRWNAPGGDWDVGNAGGPPAWYTSTDASTWAPAAANLQGYQFQEVATDGTNWAVLANCDTAGCSGSPAYVLHSADGTTWTAYLAPGNFYNYEGGDGGIAYGQGKFVVVGRHSLIYSSPNGQPPWTKICHQGVGGAGVTGCPPWAANPLQAAAYDGCRWVVVGGSGIYYSYDLMTWSKAIFGGAYLKDVAALDVGKCPPPPPLTCSPASQAILAGGTATFTAFGGAKPYAWSGGGSPSTAGNVNSFSSTFNTPGTYTITLKDYGIPTQWPAQTATCTITVVPLLVCTGPATTTVASGSEVTFTATGGTTAYAWTSPGNPASGSTATFKTKFTGEGAYTVTLADSGPPAQMVACPPITVPPPPTCAATVGSIKAGSPATFGVTGGIGPYAWSASEGAPQTGAGVMFTSSFADPGTISVSVADTGPPEQTATCSLLVRPDAPPEALFSVTPNAPHVGEEVFFVDSSKDPDPEDSLIAWTWTFSDGQVAQETSPIHIFKAAGKHNVCLVVKSSAGPSSKPTCMLVQVAPVAPESGGGSQALQGSPGSGSGSSGGSDADTEGGTDPAASGETPNLLVDAGADKRVAAGAAVVLKGFVQGGAPDTVAWRQLAGPDVALTGAATLSPGFRAPAAGGYLAFVLDASRDGVQGSDVVVILVDVPGAPVARVVPQAEVVAGSTAILDASASTASNGAALAFSWTQVAGPAADASDGSAAMTTFTPTEPGTYRFIVEVSDGRLASAAVQTVVVTAATDEGGGPVEPVDPVPAESLRARPMESSASPFWLLVGGAGGLAAVLAIAVLLLRRKRS